MWLKHVPSCAFKIPEEEKILLFQFILLLTAQISENLKSLVNLRVLNLTYLFWLAAGYLRGIH